MGRLWSNAFSSANSLQSPSSIFFLCLHYNTQHIMIGVANCEHFENRNHVSLFFFKPQHLHGVLNTVSIQNIFGKWITERIRQCGGTRFPKLPQCEIWESLLPPPANPIVNHQLVLLLSLIPQISPSPQFSLGLESHSGTSQPGP